MNVILTLSDYLLEIGYVLYMQRPLRSENTLLENISMAACSMPRMVNGITI